MTYNSDHRTAEVFGNLHQSEAGTACSRDQYWPIRGQYYLKMLKWVRYCWMVSTGDQASEPLLMMWLGAVLGTQLPRKP